MDYSSFCNLLFSFKYLTYQYELWNNIWSPRLIKSVRKTTPFDEYTFASNASFGRLFVAWKFRFFSEFVVSSRSMIAFIANLAVDLKTKKGMCNLELWGNMWKILKHTDSWIILFYLIIWSFNCVEVSNLRLTFDAGEAFLVIKSSFCAHFLCLKDLKKNANSLLHIHIVFLFNKTSWC